METGALRELQGHFSKTIKYIEYTTAYPNCISGAKEYYSFTCITGFNTWVNRGSTNGSKREIEDGFLLHRVSFSHFVTYTINLSGQFKKKNQTIFPPFENDNGKADQEYCLGEYGVKKPRRHWITYLSAAFDQSLFIAENKDCVQEIWQQHYIIQWNARSMKPRSSEYTSVVNLKEQNNY
ncbi:BnaA08g12750D [Brassica napus]|uniref:BnaA08g12750D protein n=1 Tax=Brassica napus TaxID=3708 RepID=A0A078GD07_BRANA|nr:BnaA08g12750D [Brassica napus]